MAMCAYTQAQGRWTQTDREMEAEGTTERERKAAKGKFSIMGSYHQTALQAAFLCFYLQDESLIADKASVG